MELLKLYRYLAKNSDDSFQDALDVLSDFLDILQEVESWGRVVLQDDTSIDPETFRDAIVVRVQYLLGKAADSPTDAVMWLIESHAENINLDRLITFIEHRKTAQSQAELLDEHPF
jgi:hypothetical protein